MPSIFPVWRESRCLAQADEVGHVPGGAGGKARGDQRGLAIGMNEFAGYVGVAVAGVVTAYLAELMGARLGLLLFGLAVVGLAGAATLLWVEETLRWARLEAARHATRTGPRARYPNNVSARPGTWEMFTLMTWRDRRMAAFCQAGLVEKFVDAWMWVIAPVWLVAGAMVLSGLAVWGLAEETLPRLNPATD